MARVRLKAHGPAYEGTRDNYAASNHALRALVTGATIAMMEPETIIDPAVGDASIIAEAYRLRPFKFAYLGDISMEQAAALNPHFPCEVMVGDALGTLHDAPDCDMVVLTEILEHIEDPDVLLAYARTKAKYLVASSPIGDPEGGRNHEHLWSFGEDDYEEMLRKAGWEPLAKQVQTFPGSPWNSQIWLCR